MAEHVLADFDVKLVGPEDAIDAYRMHVGLMRWALEQIREHVTSHGGDVPPPIHRSHGVVRAGQE